MSGIGCPPPEIVGVRSGRYWKPSFPVQALECNQGRSSNGLSAIANTRFFEMARIDPVRGSADFFDTALETAPAGQQRGTGVGRVRGT